MKKTFIALMCIAGATLLASCGETKEKTAEEGLAEAVEEMVEEAKAGNTEAAYVFFAKKLIGIDVAELVPDLDGLLPAEDKNFYGDDNTAVGVYYFPEEISEEDAKAYVKKVFEATKAVADGNKCVWGFEEKDTQEEAEQEMTLDDVYNKAFLGNYSWRIIKDGKFKTIDVENESKADKNFLRVKVYNALQKSFDDTMKQVEEALDDEEVQKAIKEKLGQ